MIGVRKVSYRLDELVLGGMAPDQAWQHCTEELVEVARRHIDFYLWTCFDETISSLQSSPPSYLGAPTKRAGIVAVLRDLKDLLAVKTILSCQGALLASGALCGASVATLESSLRVLYKDVRPQAVPLVDSFNMPDFVLNSALGREDGNVYENYLKIVRHAPNATGVPSYHEELIKPLTARL